MQLNLVVKLWHIIVLVFAVYVAAIFATKAHISGWPLRDVIMHMRAKNLLNAKVQAMSDYDLCRALGGDEAECVAL